MIGLRIRLTLRDKILDEIELKDTSPGTEVLEKIMNFEKISPKPDLRESKFFDTYTKIINSYNPKLMSNENLILSVNSFFYINKETK